MTAATLAIRSYRGPAGIGVVEAAQVTPDNGHLVNDWAGKVPGAHWGGWVVKTRGDAFVAFRDGPFRTWFRLIPLGDPEICA